MVEVGLVRFRQPHQSVLQSGIGCLQLKDPRTQTIAFDAAIHRGAGLLSHAFYVLAYCIQGHPIRVELHNLGTLEAGRHLAKRAFAMMQGEPLQCKASLCWARRAFARVGGGWLVGKGRMQLFA